MEKSRQQLQSSIQRYFQESDAQVESFLSEIVSRYVILSYFQDLSRSAEITQADQAQLLEIAVSILSISDNNITAHSIRLAGASMSEFVSFQDLTQECLQRPQILSQNCFKSIYNIFNQDTVYSALEQLLTESCRPFALEANNTQLAYGLKISLNSILPRSDVLVFRDMLVKETSADKPDQSLSSGQRQLMELADVTAGVTLIGEPPIQALQGLEQSIVILFKSVEVQLNQQLAVYVSSIMPVTFYSIDTGSSTDETRSSRSRETILYQINRAILIQQLGLLFQDINKISNEFKKVSQEFRDAVQSLQNLLKEKESVPKAQIYPRFAAVSALYTTLQRISEQLVRLRTWHARVSPFIDDNQFTVLPDASAAAPLYTSDELVEARAWFVQEFGRGGERVENSRFQRLALQVLTETKDLSQVKDLSHFSALDAEDIFATDCLFGGIDPVLAFGPQSSRPGFISFSNSLFTAQDLKFIAQMIIINNPKLELPDNKQARERPSASQISSNMTTISGPRGPELISFSSAQSKQIFSNTPMLFFASIFAVSLSSPDYLPMLFLCDIPRLARLAASQQFRELRESTIQRFQTQFIDILPCFRAQIVNDEPPSNGVESLVFKNIGGRKLQIDNCGYLRRPLYADLTSRYIIKRLAESDFTGSSELNVFSTPYSIDQLLSQEFLQVFAEIGMSDTYKKYSIYKRKVYNVTSETLLNSDERLIISNQIQQNKEIDYINMIDVDIQTPVHFYESNIVPGYTSSEWELRARALRLYQIQQKRTQVLQTNQTVFKQINEAQTIEYAEADTQSKHDANTREIQLQKITRKPYPVMSYASQVLKDAAGVVYRSQIGMTLDFCQIQQDSEKYKKMRESVKNTEVQKPGDIEHVVVDNVKEEDVKQEVEQTPVVANIKSAEEQHTQLQENVAEDIIKDEPAQE
ncbi:hypothetical protein SS50377_24317 [Spironucleus salmonicida]|uniref:Cilia- and flagella-associated protein 206 n=1 Tax=Spironucleus salmonicida TaxID=348837 RepID=V6LNB8_9EUKA|nr:hypothetical protein SS50377_24317 [Spironucleus salmonicida]|eukprot:EST46130.1 hypothetical protein SS50377_14127 [Spironucleus salmonicida]